ncbi:HNH endonuclease signature motif containing protein [Roseomonas sp. CAU 1739]|uniref:HNH endonuclease signature motif containing protein n=1 Tax=Roseomonas sp. CAU 1739 TaxID=3140364 RepID=UPI00325B0F4F
MIFLRLDDPDATQFHLAGAERLDGTRCTFTDTDGQALGHAIIRMVAPDTLELADAQMFSAGQGFRVLREDMVTAVAVSRGEVVRRREQAAFRRRVGEAWGWRCAITGETVREVLEAAHLPGSSWRAGDNRAVDGILLRLDLHRLMDAGLLRIEGGSVRVSVGNYAALDGAQMIWPRRKPRRGTND